MGNTDKTEITENVKTETTVNKNISNKNKTEITENTAW